MIRTLSSFGLLTAIALCGPATADESEAEAYLKYFSFYLGEWSVVEEGVDGPGGTWTLEMSPSGCSHNSMLKFGDDVTHTIYGYDPTLRTWSGVGFSTKGSRWTETVKKKSSDTPQPGDVFDYSGRSVAKDGSETLVKMRLRIIDHNTIEVKQTMVSVQGDTEPVVRTLIGKRQ